MRTGALSIHTVVTALAVILFFGLRQRGAHALRRSYWQRVSAGAL